MPFHTSTPVRFLTNRFVKRFLGLLLLLCGVQSQAQVGKYMALLIPDSLRKGADVVVRENDMTFKVKDINSATLQTHRVATVLNSDGNHELFFNQYASKFWELDDAEIIVYDAMGNKLNTYTKKEMHTSGYGEGLVEDGKTYWFDVTAANYPITIETNYTEKYKGSLAYPDYEIQLPYQSVQQTSCKVIVPNSLGGLRYRCFNTAVQPKQEQQESNTVYSWSYTNLPACKTERACGSFHNFMPYVQLAPTLFQMDDYDGNMSSWKELGNWYTKVYGNTTTLPDNRKAFFLNLVKDASSDRQKAEMIYRYLQQNMRYVSVQLGIGGWKPFAASFVDEKKYGDCKALSNYMQAALAAVGIKGYSAIIHSDQKINTRMAKPLEEDFPVNRFNHVIVCIPQPKDSIWLECTSNTTQFGEMGSGTQNTKALLITENGGVLVRTPAGKPQHNTQSCHTIIQLADDGSGEVATTMSTTGNYRGQQLYYLGKGSTDEKKKYMTDGLEWKHPDEFQITTGDRAAPEFATNAKMKYEKIPMFSTGSKMFLPVRLYPLMDEEIPVTEKRTQDYFFAFPHQNIDTTVYHLPTGFTIDYKPENKSITYPFGSYKSQWAWDAARQTLTVVAQLEISQGMVTAANYDQLSAFSKAVMADTNEKIVIKK